jgi:serine O-acetyltransferase
MANGVVGRVADATGSDQSELGKGPKAAWACFRIDRRRYPRQAWFTERTIYAVAWLRVGQAVEGLQAGRIRRLCEAVHGFGRMFISAFTGVDISRGAQFGPGLRLIHGQGVVINAFTVVGEHAVILHGVTLGQRLTDHDAPKIGDRCEIGAYAQILGAVTLGDDVRVGAAAVVLHDVPSGATVAGNPARVLPEK